MAHSLRCFSLGDTNTRRLPAEDSHKPLWQLPLYQQPERPSKRLIDAHQAAIAAERKLSVPVGLNLLGQAEAVLDEEPYTHCECCDSPVDASMPSCPQCGWGE